ncbi:MAG: TetR/AcrR family transcriptional regulator [Hyphomicrobiaceae bacterium]|nr:TetR/AcrR family transcriptional regulator [Hyphomicrobiaceae bacterium]MCC0025086.1 TetR/AcrR family transcriptional regulator [Hyphomicrobiaceae bacterium]
MARGEDTRNRILDAAIGLLGEAGIEGFSAANLAAVAGVSKANLFHHFESLDQIVLEAFERFALNMPMMTPTEDMDLRGWLIGMGDSMFGLDERESEAVRAYFLFVAKALFDEKLRKTVLGTVEQASAMMIDIVRQFSRAGTSDTEVEALGNLIFTTADGMALHFFAFPERRHLVAAGWGALVNAVAPER